MHKTILSLAALATAVWGSAAAAEKVKFEYWYGLSGDLGETLKETCTRFNAAQDKYEITCVGYDGYELVVQSPSPRSALAKRQQFCSHLMQVPPI
jgi:sn-glycerol 3-phosphate transport system substrate-binding protein